MKLTRLDPADQIRMVGVIDRQPAKRAATAFVTMACDPEVLKRITSKEMPKGDIFAVARIVRIVAAERTPESLPLAHVIGMHGAAVDLTLDPESIEVIAMVCTADCTDVEIEAPTTASVAMLVLADTAKGLDRYVHIHEVELLAREGDRSGSWRRDT